ncbi:MAG: carboxylesterase/lipase family protein [Oscillospiraceae bacterium]|nr:carboxylesterase/lipase family protein [Oscillospiraceae bacterium]
MKKLIKSVALLLALSMIFLLCGCSGGKKNGPFELGANKEITGEYDESLAAVTENGVFVGTNEDGADIWRGIPFAKAPVGELRWKAPQKLDSSDKVYEAYHYGFKPIQPYADADDLSEDCLTLNVFTGEDRSVENKPVMVFIHGGAYALEATSDEFYLGDYFARQNPDIVFVTIEYRLGILGYMNFDEVEGGEDYKEAGNLGLLDQIAALEWIQNNIKAFGGDPDNVTILGESAGAGSVSLIPVVDGTEDLYDKIIAMSGGVHFIAPVDERREVTQNIVDISGADTMDELLALPEDYIKKNIEELSTYIPPAPVLDGVILPETEAELYEKWTEATKDKAVIIGSNGNETRYDLSFWLELPEKYHAQYMEYCYEKVYNMLDPDSKKVFDRVMAEFEGTDSERWETINRIFDHLGFTTPANYQAECSSENGQTYMYFFNTPSDTCPLAKSFHSVELPLLFSNPGCFEITFADNAAVRDMGLVMQEMFVNFAKTGNPSAEGVEWPVYDANTRSTMVFTDDARTEVQNDPNGYMREIFTPLLKYSRDSMCVYFSYEGLS